MKEVIDELKGFGCFCYEVILALLIVLAGIGGYYGLYQLVSKL